MPHFKPSTKAFLAWLLRLAVMSVVVVVFAILGVLGEVRTAIAQYDVGDYQYLAEELPDYASFGTQTFGDIQFDSNGSIEGVSDDVAEQMGYNTGRNWSAGAQLSDVIKLGDLGQSFYPQALTISDIERKTGINTTDLPLSSYAGLLEQQTIESLSTQLGIEGYRLDEVAPIQTVFNEAMLPQLEMEAAQELSEVAQQLGVPVDEVLFEEFDPTQYIETELLKYGEQSIGELLATPDLLDEAVFGDMTLDESLATIGDYSISDIPGLENLPIEELEGWQDLVLSEVPGLDSIPMGDFPNPVAAITGGFGGTHDVTYGHKESRVTPTKFSITGSNEAGFRVQCAQERGCAYLELEGPGEMHGARWISGGSGQGQQMVEGGEGLLKMVNNGMEPTGRHPFGDVFKIVLTNTTESSGTGDFALYTRYCQKSFFVDLGCTPYFIGPIPLWSTKEKGFVLTGPLDGKGGASSGMEVPPELQQYQTKNLGGSYYGNSGRPPSQIQMDEECLEGILAVTPSSQQSGAAENIPIIIEAANEHGLDRAQIAYVLATVQIETGGNGWGPVEENGRPCSYSGGCGWHGRGYVQLTHDYNYARVRDELGIDVVSDPSLVMQTDTAAEILISGMMGGWFNGHGHGLDYYVSEEEGRFDYVQARRTVNVQNKAGTIASYAQQYHSALMTCETLETSIGGEVGSPIGGVSLEEAIAYQPTPGQSFEAYRAYRNGWHAGIDFDSRIGAGEGGVVTSVTSGQVKEVVVITGTPSGEPSVSVRIVSTDSEGRTIEQRYTHLSASSVQQALGVNSIHEASGMPISAGQQIGLVGETDYVSSGAHLDYKVKVNGVNSDPQQFLQAVANGGGTLRTIDVGSGAMGSTQVGAIQ